MRINLKSTSFAAFLALTLTASTATTALAGNYPANPPYDSPSACPPQYQWVLCHQTRVEPYTVCETRYDHCGRPYHVEVGRYRSVRVAVWRLVPVNANPYAQ